MASGILRGSSASIALGLPPRQRADLHAPKSAKIFTLRGEDPLGPSPGEDGGV
eukprot:CAMPEP_0195082910 /NCGR_PEP_ID=MMETSP0448-20130528/23963_1 /TAXON_ID=66468 /ORGANISM="Heterocapsa triquestra, Strain CCMP 448" /LENGTH=52 /DNA_ID=CAMNT_0040116055 /DNA_START=476 /DNA_END=634 /DNA_ORIENTATION=+